MSEPERHGSALNLPARCFGSWLNAHRLDLTISVVLFVLALAVRLPNLMLVPRFTDEGAEVLGALAILRTGQIPLTGINGFYGPFFWYLIAALFHLLGVSLIIPRLTTTVFCALLVALTYSLGRVVWDRTAGILAAGMALSSPALVIYTSHYGWSNSLTPFFATLTLLALYGGLARRLSWLVAASGVFAALTLHTHPTGLIVLLAAGVAFCLRADAGQWLRRRSPYVALVLFLLFCLPMLVANVRLDSPMVQKAGELSGILSPSLEPVEYLTRALALAKSFLFVAAGGYEGADWPLRITAAAVAVLLAAGLGLVLRREGRFVAIVLLSGLLLFPIFLRVFPLRYFMPLLPLAFVLLGIVASEALRFVAAGRFVHTRRAAAGLLLVLLCMSVVFPLLSVRAIYQTTFAQGRTNAEYFRLARVVATEGACGANLYIEDSARDFSTPQTMQTWYELHAVDYVLTLQACAHTLLSRADILACASAGCQQGWLIVPQDSVSPAREHDLRLITVASLPPVNLTRVPVALYQVGRTAE